MRMSILVEYTVTCDKCGNRQTYAPDDTDTLYKLMEEDGWEIKHWAEFVRSDGKNRHYCKDCAKKMGG
jgi:hypothetical protein